MSLIYVKHPNDEQNKNQESFLLNFEGAEQQSHALLFNYGNAAYPYHRIDPTEEDYKMWLEGMPENLRIEFKVMGYEKCRSSLPLKRFANEIRDVGMDEYIKNLLTPENYEAMSKIGKE
ncbi:hypothetical protein [Emticicia sp. TH156]|uniref:hypothetical protein n=1 Tax=Emticicia sp. TH156 TaxID=2067454 RepID=UPI000C76E347|nr:hypothetical protein [Emticicia sp. TH156]PLK42074.1 hypothetical protein C0V77_22805 [Emticicia sp. TH156]